MCTYSTPCPQSMPRMLSPICVIIMFNSICMHICSSLFVLKAPQLRTRACVRRQAVVDTQLRYLSMTVACAGNHDITVQTHLRLLLSASLQCSRAAATVADTERTRTSVRGSVICQRKLWDSRLDNAVQWRWLTVHTSEHTTNTHSVDHMLARLFTSTGRRCYSMDLK